MQVWVWLVARSLAVNWFPRLLYYISIRIALILSAGTQVFGTPYFWYSKVVDSLVKINTL